MQSSLNQITAASSSAARAIHRKIVPPNPVQAEREDFERNQFVALQKAVNTEEVPAKEKHVRTLIIGTFQEKGAHTFWALVLSRLPVQGNPVVAWKFCYVVHKMLRDGHSNVIKDSMRHQPFIQDLGRLWGHLKLGYGPLITRYCELLTVKLDFHRKNPRFPGNLHIGSDELQKIAENDPSNYFQLSVEMFDYMENILELAAAVFGSFDMSRANSMTAVGQSRLVAIIPCILDSCQLYDFIVKMMFRLHSALPQDVLTGHRERFTKQFKLLQHLYHSSNNLQYFKNMIQVPSLPERAPNFLSAVSIKEYVTPVAREQEQPEDVGGDSEGILIDTTNMNGNHRENVQMHETPSTNGFGDSINDQENSLTVKDRVIEELLQEIERLRRATDKIKSDDLVVVDDLRNRVVELEREAEEQRAQTEMERLELMRQIEQSAQNPQVMANFEELDKRAKVADEKFKKMKDVYNELREKHVGLLRDHANTEKQNKATKKSLDDMERQKNELNVEVINFNMEKEQMQRSLEDTSASVQRQLEEKAEECASLEKRLAEVENESRTLLATNNRVSAQLESLQLREKELLQKLEKQSEASNADKEHLDQRIESLTISSQQVLNDKEQELTSLKVNLQDVETELRSLTSAKSKLEAEYETMVEREKELHDRLNAQKESFIHEKEALLQSMQSSVSITQVDIAERIAERNALQTKVAEGEGQLHAVSALNRTLVADHEASSQREKALQKQLMDERNSATAEMVLLSGSMKKEKAASSEELQSKTEEITALEQRLKEVEMELENTRAAMGSLQAEHGTLLQSERALQQKLESDSKNADAQLEQMRKNMETAEARATQEMHGKIEEVTSLEQRLMEMEEILELTRVAEASAESECGKLRGQLHLESTNACSQMAALYEEMKDAKLLAQKELQDKTNEIALLEEHVMEVKKSLRTTQSAKELVEIEHKELLRTEKALQEQLERERFQKDQTQQDLRTLKVKWEADLQEKEKMIQTFSSRVASLESELQSVTESRQSIKTEHEASLKAQRDLKEELANLEADFESISFQHGLETRGLRQSLFNVTCGTAAEEIKHTVATWEHPSFTMLTSTPEFLLVCVEPALDHLRNLRSIPVGQEDRMNDLSKEILLTFHHISHCLIQCMETSHMAPIDLTDEFSLLAKHIGEESVQYLNGFRDDPQGVAALLGGLEEKLEVLQQLSTVLIPKVEDVRSDEVADMVEKELHDMDKAIEEAALKIEEMLVNSRTRDTGVKLEVNAKILDSCTTLMAAIRILVRKSRALQQEIVAAGKGFSSPKEFYKRNHRWTEGLISAAKTVGLGANVLLEAADKVVSGKGKFEELVVASQEVSAGTVQLVVSSKVKAERNSTALAELSKASKSVTQAAGAVVATSKSCAQLVEEKADLDFSSLSLHKMKKIEMDAQVKVLELESALTKEREKLASIRRQHYALAGTTEDGE